MTTETLHSPGTTIPRALPQDATAHSLATRVDSLDAFKLLAIVGVVYIHTGPFRGSQWHGSWASLGDGVLNLSFRFGVPLFFLAAGYFFMVAVLRGENAVSLLSRYAGRLLRLFALWSLLFVLAGAAMKATARGTPNAAVEHVLHYSALLQKAPTQLLLQGTMEPLWFLPALVMGLAAVVGFLRLSVPLAWGSALLAAVFVAGLLGASYQPSPLGWTPEFNTRNGPFVGAFFVTVGAWMAQRPAPRLRTAVAMAFAGWALTLIEALLLLHHYGTPVASHDNLVGTPLFAIGVLGIALARPTPGPGNRWARLGRLSLGVYLLHMIVALPVLHARERFTSVAFDVVTPLVVVAGAFCAAVLMQKWKTTAWFLK